MRPRAEAFAEAQRWILMEAPAPRSGAAGERMGSGVGSSLEFQDRRAYVAGDDVRHIDWRAYGRSDQLLVRQYREEVLPRVDLLLDDSASMALGEDKRSLTGELALLLACAARASGASLASFALGDVPRRVTHEELVQDGLSLEGRRALPDALGETSSLLTTGSLRILLSDLMFPHDPHALARQLGRGAGGVLVIQLLGRDDVDPPVGQALRLEDVETGEARELVLDQRTRERYLERLERLQSGMREALQSQRGKLVPVVAQASLGGVARDILLPAGVISPL